MEAGFSLKDSTVGIFGLGLMGGSLAMGLKGHCARLIGFDSHLPTLELALSKNIVDQAESDSATSLLQADLFILATPVSAILTLIQQLPALMPNPCIVMDLGSTKTDILCAMNGLPSRFEVIGGHPICGKETLGLENADSNLYQGAPFVITPLERTSPKAKIAAQQIASAIGAYLIEMTAKEHDRVLAQTSHLPFLISSALALSTPPEFSPAIGSGFRSTSRLATTPSHMMMGILKSNRKNILQSLLTFRNALNELEIAIENDDDPTLRTLLDKSRYSYESLLHPSL